MYKASRIFFLLITMVLVFACNQTQDIDKGIDLYEGFVNPPAEAKPFMRWWWNGNHLDRNEIVRQLDVLQQAGIGGVEINPIAMPPGSRDIGTVATKWLSEEWNHMLHFAATEAQKRNMIADIIVGSGWPFGGEFLKKEETLQRVLYNAIPVKGGDRISEDLESLFHKANNILRSRHEEEPLSNRMHFIRLVSTNARSTDDMIDLMDNFNQNGTLDYFVPEGSYDLCYGILQHGPREVMHGAPGAAGPVMNHFDKKVTMAYLNRLQKISEDTGVPLKNIIRVLFCDSIELAGANWTDDFDKIFEQTYGYALQNYLPFIFYEPSMGYAKSNYSLEFQDELSRVRFDFNKLLVDVFIENFLKPFQQYCIDNDLLCRYQAYGTPFLMGIMEGNLIPDIPESNNWIYSSNMDAETWEWNHAHGYMIWNLYAASAGHLKGRKIISCEAMTNTKGVFKTSLEEIKQHDDMNFISGMNHAVLHGYNYSPKAAGFPGWVRYGTYFSEQNTWWPFFKRWVDYNARLSYVFQNSQPQKQIAILVPKGDVWSANGLSRGPFHTSPWYAYRLWESLSQSGSSCDYINEQIIIDGDVSNGLFKYGPMEYEAILLADVKSIKPETARALLQYVQGGGKLVIINGTPHRSLSLKDAASNDASVQNAFAEIHEKYSSSVLQVEGPSNEADLLDWTINLIHKSNISPQIQIAKPDKSIYQIKKKNGNQDIFFLVNAHRNVTKKLEFDFNISEKTAWIWSPEDGTKRPAHFINAKGWSQIELDPLQSLLVVFTPTDIEPQSAEFVDKPGKILADLNNKWNVQFHHIDGTRFDRTVEKLKEYGSSDELALSTFAGTITYSTKFNFEGNGNWLVLEKVHQGITEVFLNGESLGVNWYGNPRFPIKDLIRKGENSLEIKYTSVIANYARSLKNNPTAVIWTKNFESNIKQGIEGKVMLCE